MRLPSTLLVGLALLAASPSVGADKAVETKWACDTAIGYIADDGLHVVDWRASNPKPTCRAGTSLQCLGRADADGNVQARWACR